LGTKPAPLGEKVAKKQKNHFTPDLMPPQVFTSDFKKSIIFASKF